MKICFKCHQPKPLSEYYRHAQMADGHLNKCKACTKADSKRRLREQPEKVAAYEKRRWARPERKAAIAASSERWAERFPDRRRAHTAVHNALRDGKLKRLPCQHCGAARAHAHHEDYSKLLDVVWLCPRCHQRHHHQGK